MSGLLGREMRRYFKRGDCLSTLELSYESQSPFKLIHCNRITCGLYVSIILNDYLRTILNLNDNPLNSDWTIDPRKTIPAFDSEGLPQGVGNQVSAEFNMIYRWHAAISDHDEKWANELATKVFGGRVDVSMYFLPRLILFFVFVCKWVV